MKARLKLAALTVLALVGCVNFEPKYRQPALPVSDSWPIAATTATSAAAGPESVADIGWRDFFVDDHLRQLIALALKNNRDLRVAVLDVEQARAQYHIQRASRLPEVDATGNLARERTLLELSPTVVEYGVIQQYSAGVGVSAFELDLFSRVRNLSHAALEQYLATEEARRSAQLGLIAEIANAYLTLAADRQLKQLAEQTLKSQEDSYHLTEQQHNFGAVSALDVSQARTTVESARADAARYDGNVQQDIDALTLLVGAPVDPALLPTSLDAQVTGLSELPSQLPSQVLLRRPDVRQAEHQLRATDADIGAARAAFFPTIALTGTVGSASTDLSGLFKIGTETWGFTPQITLPIFAGGRLKGNLDVAKANRDIAIAQYEKAVQSGFREVADGLALTATLERQLGAQQALADAAGNAFNLSQQRYKAGRDSYLVVLDAQRINYSAQQGLIATRLAQQSNRVTLYKVLGGGWKEGP